MIKSFVQVSWFVPSSPIPALISPLPLNPCIAYHCPCSKSTLKSVPSLLYYCIIQSHPIPTLSSKVIRAMLNLQYVFNYMLVLITIPSRLLVFWLRTRAFNTKPLCVILQVHIGNEEYAHVRIFKALPCHGGNPQVHAFQVGKTKTEKLEYF